MSRALWKPKGGGGVSYERGNPALNPELQGPRRPLSLELSDTGIYESQIPARLGTYAHLCEVLVLKVRTVCKSGFQKGWPQKNERTVLSLFIFQKRSFLHFISKAVILSNDRF